MCYNICDVFYINKLGGAHSSPTVPLYIKHLEYPCSIQHYMLCNVVFKIIRTLLYWTLYLPGYENYNADWFSRSFSNYNNDFSLSHQAFACVIERLPFPLKVDMFASKYSFKLSHYVSIYFESPTWKVDVFSFPWPNKI